MAVRALSGIAMGGTYGTSAATSLEDAPIRARSFLSGLFFTAYPFGLVFAAIFWQAFKNTEKTWRSLFWFSAGIPFILIIWRLLYPETVYFTRVLKARKLIKQDQINAGTYVESTFKDSLRNVGKLCAKYWVLFVYLIVLMAGPNYLTHASQDMYPTMLRKQLQKPEDNITLMIVITNLGGVVGSVVVGTFMEVLGRRLSILICCVCGGAFLYPAYMVHEDPTTFAGGFFLFFFIMGIWGIIPAHLSELSPPDARVLVSGLAYQLGNLASSASSTIETRLADNWPLEFDDEGVATRFNYSKVMAILTGAVFIYMLCITFLGPEKFHRDLSSPTMKKYIEKVIEIENNHDDIEAYLNNNNNNKDNNSSPEESSSEQPSDNVENKA
jgi:SHS family lactate transporter-like MFS transporter